MEDSYSLTVPATAACITDCELDLDELVSIRRTQEAAGVNYGQGNGQS